MGFSLNPFNCVGLELTLITDKTTYALGEEIQMTFTVENTSGKTINIGYGSSQTYDYYATHNGNIVWQWSYRYGFYHVVWNYDLAPGESLIYNDIWDMKDNGSPAELVSPGKYKIYATLEGAPDTSSSLTGNKSNNVTITISE